jgi:hypothetical protein
MNVKQLLVVMLSTALVTVIGAYPPMRVIARYTDGTLFAQDVRGEPLDYDIRLAPRGATLASVKADCRRPRQLMEAAGVLAAAGTGLYLLRSRRATPAP